ncbi:glucuronate isomerase [Algoriphagus halophytocola]|uniref:Uronate isomerase n=1 Tax=Algoriphagus halophytocola TaxID=2991499 RepID=A0ABY6MPR6_9BACT|nr:MULTISPECIES: glucuronate isomerase [unclassified Algoriphagus]UZD24532.1 glucuronate isomerase [Algoriphagus sp. TR-M5]WBL41896.1 glucuronate isomerase [Algoriphagus sp. TR-M9]
MSTLTAPKTDFISEDFLLQNEFAKNLYHQYAAHQPIIDYHCHLSPKDIAENRQFSNVSDAWLGGDHYKWRAMRTLGIDEKYITGDSLPEQKFQKWGETVPYTLRNPLYHWTHLELKRYFGIDELLSGENAQEVYESCTYQLRKPNFTAQGLLGQMNVKVVCSTDDPADDLKYHAAAKGNLNGLALYPAFRPDKAFAVENPTAYKAYLETLGKAAKLEINSYEDLLSALQARVDFFDEMGCKLSDHGMERLYFFQTDQFNVETLFQRVIRGNELNQTEIEFFKFKTLIHLCKMYHQKNWTQQFHLGALRNTNERMLSQLGPDTGFDSIGDFEQAVPLAGFLNELDKTDQLAKTILYNLNPRDNEVFATMTGNFNDGSTKGKVQFGSGWWFLDQKDGMEKQLNALSNMGMLSCFVGMLTDSRSFLSFPRHEYFRRTLCNLIGKDVASGELPADEKWLGKIVSDICYHNAKEFFQFN